MRWLIIVFVAYSFVFVNGVQADVTLRNGLFLEAPDLADEIEQREYFFQGTTENNALEMGMSVRFGSFIFGFESFLNDGGDNSNPGNIVTHSNENISAGLSVVSERTHRILMGWQLPNKSVLYGFNGVTDRTTKSNVSYSAFEDFTYFKTQEVYENCEWVQKRVAFEGTYSSSGFGQSEQSNFGYTFGGGLEQAFLGGVLRFEYAATRFDEMSQSININRSSSSAEFQSSGPDTHNVTWDDHVEQKIQLRWHINY